MAELERLAVVQLYAENEFFKKALTALEGKKHNKKRERLHSVIGYRSPISHSLRRRCVCVYLLC